MTLVSAIVLLFLVMDPMGNIPLFLAVLKDVDEKRRRRIIVRELFVALIVLILFLATNLAEGPEKCWSVHQRKALEGNVNGSQVCAAAVNRPPLLRWNNIIAASEWW